jgi:hypothetical protein
MEREAFKKDRNKRVGKIKDAALRAASFIALE